MTISQDLLNADLSTRGINRQDFRYALQHAEWLSKRTAAEPESLGYAKLSSNSYTRRTDSLRDDLERSLISFSARGLYEALELVRRNEDIDLVIYDRYENLMDEKSQSSTVEEVVSARKRFSRALQPLGAALRAFGSYHIGEADLHKVIDELEILGARKYYQSPQHVAHMGREPGYPGSDIRDVVVYARGLANLLERGLPNLLPHLERKPDFVAFINREPRNPTNYRNAFPAAMVLAHNKATSDINAHDLPLAAHGVIFETLLGRVMDQDLDSIKRIADNHDLSATYAALANEKPVKGDLKKPLNARSNQFTPLLLIGAVLDSARSTEEAMQKALETVDVLLNSGLRPFLLEPLHLAQLTSTNFENHIIRNAHEFMAKALRERIPYKSLVSHLTPIEVVKLKMKGSDLGSIEYMDRLRENRGVLAEIIPKLSHDDQKKLFGVWKDYYSLIDDDRKYATAPLVVEDRLTLDLGL